MLTVTTRFLSASAICACLMANPLANAFDFNWNVAGPADWNVGANWTSLEPTVDGQVPFGGDGNHVHINNGGTAEINADISDIHDIFVGDGAANSGTLNQTAGNTNTGTGSWMFVGQNGGTGTYNLSGGIQGKGRLYVGRHAGSNGTLNVSGTGTVNGDELNIGVDGGTGTAAFSGDSVVAVNFLAQFANGTMSVTENASITAGTEFWAGNGAGNSSVVNVDSGSIEAGRWLAIGRDSATGVVNLSGTARLAKVGADESFITLGGLGTGGGGTLNVSGEAVVDSAVGMILSETAGRHGIVNQSGGTVTLKDFAGADFTSSLHVDASGSGMGEYHLSGGLLDAETIELSTGTFDMTGGTLSATEFIGNLAQDGGTTSPGNSPGLMTITGDYALNSGDLFIELDGLLAGTEYDQLAVTGDVTLAGDLTLALGFAPAGGEVFTIIDNQGANPVSGMFTQGASITAGGVDFTIDYAGGDGNDVVLIAVPEPATCLLFTVGALALVSQRRRS